MRNRCTRTLSLLSVIVFIGLSSSMAAEITVVRGQLRPPAQELVQGLFVSLEEGSTHMEISRVDVRGSTAASSFAIFELEITPCVSPIASAGPYASNSSPLRNQMPPLEVRLPERESHGAGAGAATVSVKQLMHPPAQKGGARV